MDEKRGSKEKNKEKNAVATIRVNDETQAKFKELISEFKDGTAGDLLEVMIGMYEYRQTAQELGVVEDLEEVEAITKRLFGIFKSSMDRSQTNMVSIRSELERKISQLRSSEESLVNELAVTKELCLEKDSQVSALEDKVEALEKDNNKLKAGKAKENLIQSFADDWKERVEKLEAENSRLGEMLSGAESELRDRNAEADKLIFEVGRLNREIKDIERRKDMIIDAKTEEIESLKRALDRGEQEVNRQIFKNAELEDKVKELESSNADLRSKANGLEGEGLFKDSQVLSRNDKIDEQSKRITELEEKVISLGGTI